MRDVTQQFYFPTSQVVVKACLSKVAQPAFANLVDLRHERGKVKLSEEAHMKIFAVAGLIALALTTAGCSPRMRGMMHGGMGEVSAANRDSSSGSMMGQMHEKGMMKMMPCCEQCPMMKGHGQAT